MTGPLAELPGWLLAAGWGGVSASGLLIGAVGGYYTPLQHATIARAMTFAAGVLLAVVAVDLLINSRLCAGRDSGDAGEGWEGGDTGAGPNIP